MSTGIPRHKKNILPEQVDPLYRTLLENRAMTTDLLELLTGSVVAARSCNRVRGNTAVRSSVLFGNGVIFLYARSTVNLSLLPRAAAAAVLAGQVPLGRIFAGYVPENRRGNFSCFSAEDERLIPIMYGRLETASPPIPASGKGFDGSASCRINGYIPGPTGKHLSGLAENRAVVHEFPGRSYDIFAGGGRVAHIEEIFSPQIMEQAVQRAASPGTACCIL